MEYYALVNTAHPATGFIGVGEVLTEAQTAALGAEKIGELVSAGVLAEMNGGAENGTRKAEPEPEPEPAEDGAEEFVEDEETPELAIDDGIIGGEAEEKPAGTRKRRKGK